MSRENQQKMDETAVGTMAYIYAVLLKVSERSLTAEQGLGKIKEALRM